MPTHKFLFSIVAGLVLASALALVACGGGGISEKQLYYDVAAAEDRGDLEARKQANGCVRGGLDVDVEKYASLAMRLQERYRNEVLTEYGVTQEQWREIGWKGAKERWDTPPVPTCD